MTDLFQPVYPWQKKTWQRLTHSYPNLSHALLFSGNKGMGKHDFVMRLVTWLLCQDKHSVSNNEHACGSCQSCLWMRAQTHPNYLHITKNADSKSDSIKVEDIRKIVPFTQQSSQGMRVVFIEKAERMTLSSANALLKTLEEPAKDVLILLTSDKPQQLLPTIHSRVQNQKMHCDTVQEAIDFFEKLPSYQKYKLSQKNSMSASAPQLLTMASGSPLLIEPLLQSNWFKHRQTWLVVWQALRSGQRDHITASQYWQKQQLDFTDADELQSLMCCDVLALINDLPSIQEDIDFSVLNPLPESQKMIKINDFLIDSRQAVKQNTQTSYLYDKLMLLMADV